MKTLRQLNENHNCDKGDSDHSFEGQSFLDVYELFFRDLRYEPLNFLELGVRDGRSLRLWREYFTNARIVGVDINPACEYQDTKGCSVFICAQNDKKYLDELSTGAEGWDIIIDDASHLNVLTKQSFEILWPHVRSGGLYIIEDLKVSHMDLSHTKKDWNFVDLDKSNPTRKNDRKILNQLFMEMIENIDNGVNNARSIHFFHQMAIIQKI